MNQKQIEEKRLKSIIRGMKNKGYRTTVIRLNIVVTFIVVMVVFSIPYSFAVNTFHTDLYDWKEMLISVIVSLIAFFGMQKTMNKRMVCPQSLVKDLSVVKPIYKKHFILKHCINVIFSIFLYLIGLTIKNLSLCNIASYLLAFDLPHLFFRILFLKTKKDAFLVFYPSSLRGALIFERDNKD